MSSKRKRKHARMHQQQRWLLAIRIDEEPGMHEAQVVRNVLSTYLGDDILWLANMGYTKMIGSVAEAAARRDYFQQTLDGWVADNGLSVKITVTRHRPEEVFPDRDPTTLTNTFLVSMLADLRHRVPEIDDTEALRLQNLAGGMINEPCVLCGKHHRGIGWQTIGIPRRAILYAMCETCFSDERQHRLIKAALENSTPLGQRIVARNVSSVSGKEAEA